jgi:hypothetical protein
VSERWKGCVCVRVREIVCFIDLGELNLRIILLPWSKSVKCVKVRKSVYVGERVCVKVCVCVCLSLPHKNGIGNSKFPAFVSKDNEIGHKV